MLVGFPWLSSNRSDDLLTARVKAILPPDRDGGSFWRAGDVARLARDGESLVLQIAYECHGQGDAHISLQVPLPGYCTLELGWDKRCSGGSFFLFGLGLLSVLVCLGVAGWRALLGEEMLGGAPAGGMLSMRPALESEGPMDLGSRLKYGLLDLASQIRRARMDHTSCLRS